MSLSYADSLEIRTTIIALLRGVLYKDANLKMWGDMLKNIVSLGNYFQIIGLRLHIDEAEGYAFLKQDTRDEEVEGSVPSLIRRQQLPYHQSLMCVLLRKKLVEQDAEGSEHRLILSREELREMMAIYMPTQSNETKVVKQIDADTNKLCDYGLLRELKGEGERFEVMRIVKSLVDADWLVEFNNKLEEYIAYGRNDA
jgi:hypothetical protein